MAKPKRKPAPVVRANGPVDTDRLQSMLMEWAERRPEVENRVLTIARACGLAAVEENINRLRRYAKAHRSH